MGNPSFLTITKRTLFGISIAYVVIFVFVTAITQDFDPEFFVFLSLIVVIPTLVGLALMKWSGKLTALAAVVGILLVLLNAPFSLLFNVTATVDFIFTAIGSFGGLIVTIAATMAFVGRNDPSPRTPSPIFRNGLSALVILPVLVAIVGFAGWALGGSDVSESEKASATAVTIKEFDFGPKTITSDSSALFVKNSDLFLHNFTVDELDIDVEINPGRETLVDISDVDAGTYAVTCSIEGHESMEATLEIR